MIYWPQGKSHLEPAQFMDVFYLVSFGYRYNFLSGDRGIGKTYTLRFLSLNRFLKEGLRTIWIVRSEDQKKNLYKNNGEKFFQVLIKNEFPELSTDDFYVSSKDDCIYYKRPIKTVNGKKLFKPEVWVEFGFSNTYYKQKGASYDENKYAYIVFDELIPEYKERSFTDYDNATSSLLQSLLRDNTTVRVFFTMNWIQNADERYLQRYGFSLLPKPNQYKQINRAMNAIIMYGFKDTENYGDAGTNANSHTQHSTLNWNSVCKPKLFKQLYFDRQFYLYHPTGQKYVVGILTDGEDNFLGIKKIKQYPGDLINFNLYTTRSKYSGFFINVTDAKGRIKRKEAIYNATIIKSIREQWKESNIRFTDFSGVKIVLDDIISTKN